MLETDLRVNTPEQVALEFRIAGIGSRVLAQLIDLLVLGVFYTALVISIGVWGGGRNIHLGISYVIGITIVFVFVTFWGYFIALEYLTSGKTLGKWLFRVRVVSANGRSVTFYAAALRNLFRIVDFLPTGYLLGFIIMLIDKHERRLGDIISGTVVVVDKPVLQLSSLLLDVDSTVSEDRPPSEQRVPIPGLTDAVLVVPKLPPAYRERLQDMKKRLRELPKDTKEKVILQLWSEFMRIPGMRVERQDGTELDMELVMSAPAAWMILRTVMKKQRKKRKGRR